VFALPVSPSPVYPARQQPSHHKPHTAAEIVFETRHGVPQTLNPLSISAPSALHPWRHLAAVSQTASCTEQQGILSCGATRAPPVYNKSHSIPRSHRLSALQPFSFLTSADCNSLAKPHSRQALSSTDYRPAPLLASLRSLTVTPQIKRLQLQWIQRRSPEAPTNSRTSESACGGTFAAQPSRPVPRSPADPQPQSRSLTNYHSQHPGHNTASQLTSSAGPPETHASLPPNSVLETQPPTPAH